MRIGLFLLLLTVVTWAERFVDEELKVAIIVPPGWASLEPQRENEVLTLQTETEPGAFFVVQRFQRHKRSLEAYQQRQRYDIVTRLGSPLLVDQRVKVNGREGWKFIYNQDEQRVYRLYLLTEESVYVLDGLADRERFSTYLPAFKALSNSFRPDI